MVAEVTATPMSLSLGAAPGQSITKNIVVRSKRPLKITGVACDSSFFFQTSRGGQRNSGDPTHLHGWRAAGEVREEDQNQIGFGRKRRAGNYLPRQRAGRQRRNACRGAAAAPATTAGPNSSSTARGQTGPTSFLTPLKVSPPAISNACCSVEAGSSPAASPRCAIASIGATATRSAAG